MSNLKYLTRKRSVSVNFSSEKKQGSKAYHCQTKFSCIFQINVTAFLSKTIWCVKHLILTVIKIVENGCVSKSEGNITEIKHLGYSKLFLKLP